jgi:hypothetical protein
VEAQFIDLLSKEETEEYLSRVLSLRQEWREWTDGDINMPYYVLGATSYADARINSKIYYKIKNYYNRILLENFDDLYKKIIIELNNFIGPSELEDALAYPGFHIMGDDSTSTESREIEFPTDYIGKRHQDHIYNYHLEVLRDKYSDVNLEDNFSFTLSLKLPRGGSGLSVWSNGNLKHYESNQQFEIDIRDNGFYKDSGIEEPEVIPYKEGSMFLFSGNLYHQVAPLYRYYLDDRRITLQGHSVMCDGVWRVYF